ncbi:dihydrofolate synthase [Aureimonas ureilytica]|uniref:Dihydrofolate synthase n=1 Tax=Aureimonas ureilytica TaxID=401562 RepID=A0A175RAC2_9HYPH|nr:NAD-dependent epimerase/dehydratase family protein [Aureimonas ureilytica]KTQ96682.1 dihydrofolate synthase [Aureimonas ureilytica]
MLTGESILVTGCTGFIAKHIVVELVRRGAKVRGTLRDPSRAIQIHRILRNEGLPIEAFSSVTADLREDAGWADAVRGCRFVMHTASPFPAYQPRSKFALVPAARGGTVRVLEGAENAGVERVVLTSSIASIYYGHDGSPGHVFGEGDWSRVESDSISPYAVSKTEAERAAWNVLEGSATQLVAINPSLVFGPLLDARPGTSASLIRLMMGGRLPAFPRMGFGVVDVRDVAQAHVAALTVPDAAGRRFVLNGGNLTLSDIVAILTETYPDLARRLPRREVPDGLIRFAARLSSRVRMLAAELGPAKQLDAGPARSVLGLSFRSPEEAVRSLADSLFREGLVRR